MKILQANNNFGASLQDMTNHGLFFLPNGRSIPSYDLVVTWVQFSKGTESMQPPQPFCMALSPTED